MDISYQINRRKACDLCSLKKIKCDMLKPTCSNCELYKADCHTTRVRKKLDSTPRSKRKQLRRQGATDETRPQPEVTESEVSEPKDSVEARLTRIEQHLQIALPDESSQAFSDLPEHTATLDNAPALPFSDPLPDSYLFGDLQNQYLPQTYQLASHIDDFDDIVLDPVNQILSWGSDELTTLPNAEVSQDFDASSREPLGAMTALSQLPPLAEIQPKIDYYFANINSCMPLFSQKKFYCMLQNYYQSPSTQPRSVWAAVNVILALSSRVSTTPSRELDLGTNDVPIARYINNAQSLLPELLSRDADLLDLQVVLGLIIMFLTLKDSRPAVVLIATAVRLAHQLRLHVRGGGGDLSQDEVLERERVVWITYILDKDISLRYNTPSIQDDADMNLNLPSVVPDDGAGMIYSKGRKVSINFFLLRVKLAEIQGRTYKLLFSAQSATITAHERRSRITSLHRELEQWRKTIPAELQPPMAVDHVPRSSLVWLCVMHFSYLGCLVMIHGIWSHDSGWRNRLTHAYGCNEERGITDGGDRPEKPPPLPTGWKICSQMSRDCMTLIYRMPLSDCNLWANGCAYFSAMIILVANLFEHALAENADEDLQLISFAVGLLDKMSDASTPLAMKRMNVVAAELDRRVRFTVDNARRDMLAAAQSSLGMERQAEVIAYTEDFGASVSSRRGLQWSWGSEGVEAWPNMDFSVSLTERV